MGLRSNLTTKLTPLQEWTGVNHMQMCTKNCNYPQNKCTFSTSWFRTIMFQGHAVRCTKYFQVRLHCIRLTNFQKHPKSNNVAFLYRNNSVEFLIYLILNYLMGFPQVLREQARFCKVFTGNCLSNSTLLSHLQIWLSLYKTCLKVKKRKKKTALPATVLFYSHQ